MTNSVEYLVGLLVGLAVGLAVFAVMAAMRRRRMGQNACQYDERQELMRGKAYQWGFYTLAIAFFVRDVAKEMGFVLFDSLAGAAAVIMLGFAVFAVVCIKRDAYLSLQERTKSILVLLAAVCVSNLALAVFEVRRGQALTEGGRLASSSVNLICAVFVGVMLIALVIKLLAGRRGETEE